MPEAVDVGDLERARLARDEIGISLAAPLLSEAKEALVLHVATHGPVTGYRTELRILAGERRDVVVVELEGPPRMLFVLACDCLAERGGDARMRVGASVDLARHQALQKLHASPLSHLRRPLISWRVRNDLQLLLLSEPLRTG